jgi:hypothetical protein
VKANVVKSKLAQATVTAQGVTYKAKTSGSGGNAISITLTSGGTAGSEVVTVSGKSISVQIASGATTQTNLKTKLDANSDASALIETTINSGATTVVSAAAVNLANGTDKDEFQTEKKFDGNYADCLAGPPINSMTWPRTAKGWPMKKITPVGINGSNSLMTMKSIIEIGLGSSVNLANGYNYQNLFLGEAAAYIAAPQIFRPLSTAPPTTNPYYTWYCYDPNGEIRYGIKLAIHEFNTKVEFLKWYSSNKVNTLIANPDIGGDEGTGCDYVSSENTCNDFIDIDDLISLGFPKEKQVL